MATASKSNQYVRTSAGNINATIEIPQAAIDAIRKQAIAKARKQLKAVRAEVVTFIDNYVLGENHRGHTLKDFEKMGHPFGYRNAQNIDEPWYQVHHQESFYPLFSEKGGISKSYKLFKQGVSESKGYLKVWVSINPDFHTISTKSGELPLAGMIHHGTSKMRPRPFLTLGTVEYLRSKSMLR